jgi:hypothetical protein
MCITTILMVRINLPPPCSPSLWAYFGNPLNTFKSLANGGLFYAFIGR